VTLHSSECPVDLEEVAEAYVRYTLPEEQAIAFEDHYATCETCATVLYKTVDYVDAVRAVAKTRVPDAASPPVGTGERGDLASVG
jgi:anti-sigma factor RsiW